MNSENAFQFTHFEDQAETQISLIDKECGYKLYLEIAKTIELA